MNDKKTCEYCAGDLWYDVDYGVNYGVIRVNCPICNPHPGSAANRKQRIEEMCKVMVSKLDVLEIQDPFMEAYANYAVTIATKIIDKIDALDGGGE